MQRRDTLIALPCAQHWFRRFASASCLLLALLAPGVAAQSGFGRMPPAEWLQVRYYEPKTSEFSKVQEYMQREQMLEIFAAIIEEKVKWKPPLALVAAECGTKNAFYAPGERMIVLCYELVQARLQAITTKLKNASPDIVLAAAIGSVAFVMLHELGHALLHMASASFLGREEDVADQFAAYMILESKRTVHSATMAFGALVSYDDANLYYSQRHYAGTHALDPQRRYNLACWIFGWSPGRMGAVASYARLPKERLARCESEYAQIKRGVEAVFASALR
jgi:hypothetical protein